MLDDARLLTQLVGLERRTARGGRDSIDHAPGGHDDLANAVAGVSADYAKGNFDLDLYTRMDWVMGPDFASRGGRPPSKKLLGTAHNSIHRSSPRQPQRRDDRNAKEADGQEADQEAGITHDPAPG